MADMENKFNIVGYRVIYAYTIDDEPHMGLVKIAERIFHLDDDDVKLALSDAMILKEKVTVELPADAHLEKIWFGLRSEVIGDITINARMIYDLAEQQNIPSVTFLPDGADLWFKTDLTRIDSIIEAARQEAVKQENNRRERELSELGDSNKKKKTIKTPMHKRPNRAIRFRPEQQRAIADTVEHFSNSKGNGWKPRFLWNAKMRFGKTLSALEVAKRGGYKSVLIITHRPVVDDGWHEDFEKIFFDKPGYKYGSRNINDDDNIGNFEDLTRQTEIKDGGFVFFVSMQFLRLSSLVGGENNDPLKRDIMNYDWDMVVVDEAHEGIKTNLGNNVLERIIKNRTFVLYLSGTPFNLYYNFKKDEIYTWDYIAEQKAKNEWNKTHSDDPNPYIDLPKLNIFTLSLNKMIDGDGAQTEISFRDLFKVRRIDGQIAGFEHEAKVRKFLDALIASDPKSNYPFCRPEFQQKFRHTFWVVPGIDEAEALKKELQRHPVFSKFNIIKVAGADDYEDNSDDAYTAVKRAIAGNDYTITISVNKLTVGVTIPEWTAILYLKGNMATSAASYMQTIFRCQSASTPYGTTKTNCYVFDFLPDRAIQVIGNTIDKRNSKSKREKALKDFIDVCPIASLDSGEMVPYDVDSLVKRLNQLRISEEKYKIRLPLEQTISQYPDIEYYVNHALKDTKSKIIAIDRTGEVLYNDNVASLYRQIITDNLPSRIRELGITIYEGNIISSLEEMSKNPKMNKDFNSLIKKMEAGKPHDPVCIIDNIEYFLLTQYPTDMKFTRLAIINKKLNLGYKFFMTPDHNERNDELIIVCSL